MPYVLGWSTGGTVAENTASASIGFLTLDSGNFPAAVASITATGLGGASYSVDPGTFEVTVSGALDHETSASVPLSILITFTDMTDNGGETVNFAVNDVNEAPVLLPFGNVTNTIIGENAIGGRQVALVTVTDPDLGDSAALSLIGPDAGLFVLDGLRVRLANGVTLDHAAAPTLQFTVRATDTGGLQNDQAFSVQVEDVVTQATNLQAILGSGNGSAVGLTVSMTAEGALIQLGSSAFMLAGQDTLATADGELAFGAGTNQALLTRMFLGIAGRQTNGLEMMAVLDHFSHGATAVDVAQALLHGSEFTSYVQANSGAQDVDGLSNGQFVEILYNRVLGRTSDSGGFGFWSAELDGGVLSRAEMATLFATSSEAQGLYANSTRALWAVDAQALQVRSLYDIALNREPDAGGQAFWRSVLEQGVSVQEVAGTIISSSEFQALIGGLTTGQIVELFYVNGLERASDNAGKAFWTGLIDQGLASWGNLLVAFSESPEQTGQFHSYLTGSDIFA